MNFKGWRLHFIIFAFVVSLTLLLGGNWLLRHLSQEKPLTDALLENKTVEAVAIDSTGAILEIRVKLRPVDNLQRAYQEIETSIRKVYDQPGVKLVIQDQRSPALEKLWLTSQYAIYEAAVQGNFTKMATAVDQLARQAGLDNYAVNIDANNIYLQLSEGENYLYQVVPRQNYMNRGEA
ncbi:MAG: hypothetical protein GX039_04665 [Clostridia bacterium]|nr:hypothetical protein [Clostridia bacterium]